MKFTEKLERFRCGGTVRRYHSHRLIRPPNNAEHMYNVAILVDQIYRRAYGFRTPSAIIVEALYHDQAELETGDSPGWVKRLHPELKTVLTKIELEVEARLGISAPTGRLGNLIKVADDLEHLWTCLDERRLGNQMLGDIFIGGIDLLEKRIAEAAEYPWADIASEVLHHILDCYGDMRS